VLAIVGAVTGVFGAVLGVMSYVRDRARILVRARLIYRSSGSQPGYFATVYVVNAGRQPVATVEVAMRQGPSPRFLQRRIRGGDLLWIALSEDDDPVVLTPGELQRFETSVEPDRLAGAYAYARDALGRVRTSDSITSRTR
jgi:hypothetical protein